MAILSHKDKTYGAETSTTLISIGTYDLVRIIALSGVWKTSSGSTPTGQLLCSFTEAIRAAPLPLHQRSSLY